MSTRRRRLRRSPRGRGWVIALRAVAVLTVVAVLLAGVGAASAAALVDSWLQDLPDINAPGAFEVARATKIYSADGKLLARLYLENREVVPIAKISTDLANAVVAIEDERFYAHNGVDPVGLGRAVVVNLQRGFGEEGASTITQQYIRNTILLNERTDISVARKVREAYLAMELEKRYDKREILQMYLNAVYFGEGAYGAQAASRTYFSKPAKNLTLAEAALLAGLPQQPSRLDPYENPDGATVRRNEVLSRMLEQGFISKAQYDEAVSEKLALHRDSEPDDGIFAAHYFVAHVKKELQSKFSPDVVFKGGLTVYTSLDTRMQKIAEQSVNGKLPKGGPDGALVAIDPRDGHVKALVGGRDYRKSKFNLATQGKRQPGSSFKTFVLVAALEQGMPPWYRVDSSSPAYIPTKPKPWVVSNSEGQGRGSMTLENATHASVNTVFARVIWGIGAKKVANTAKRMGIETPLGTYPSMALGAANVSPFEMASAYGTLANNGVHNEPVVITKVVAPDGKVLLKAKTRGNRVLKAEIAAAATDVLRGVINGGTARRAQIGRPAAGKTGTSQNNRDVWFVGYTPQLVTAVWVGHRIEKPIYLNGSRAFGVTVCAPIWAAFMKRALANDKKLSFKGAKQPRYNASKFRIPHGTVPTVKKVEPAKPTTQPAAKPTKPKPKPVNPPVDPPPSDPTTPTP